MGANVTTKSIPSFANVKMAFLVIDAKSRRLTIASPIRVKMGANAGPKDTLTFASVRKDFPETNVKRIIGFARSRSPVKMEAVA